MKKRRKGVIALVKNPICECISRIKKGLSPNVYKGRTTIFAACGVRNGLHWMRSGPLTISENSLPDMRHIRVAERCFWSAFIDMTRKSKLKK